MKPFQPYVLHGGEHKKGRELRSGTRKEMALIYLRGFLNNFSENNIKTRIAGFQRRNGMFEREEFKFYAAI